MEQNQEIYRQQAQILTEMSEKSDCVLVGRCADYILKDKNPVKNLCLCGYGKQNCALPTKAPKTNI